jgi:predicted nucleotidyltransferase
MTQHQLAERVGTTQSAVSAYEAGRRQPTLPVLLRLLGATGHVLDGALIAADPPSAVPFEGPLGRRVQGHRAEILAVAERYGARNVRLFGSVARGAEQADSDVDFLVDLPPGTGLFALGRLRRDLEQLLEVQVDVVPAEGLKPEARARIESDAVPV